ncbi:MAG TPA: protein kinase, partial [Candidatus Acidoferrum sp.]|nr:protein kinase [Candidatus Acidoferrum sp.]
MPSTMSASESHGARCMSPERLAAFANGELPVPARRDVEAHLAHCADCRRLLSDATVTRGSVADTPGLADASRLEHATTLSAPAGHGPGVDLPVGAAVGRYLVQGRLGVGGMGVVYAALDPELGRKVALKLLRSDAVSAADLSTVRERLLREAQAMARLAHPNVVAVFDVGGVGDQIFVAMELVEGETLARWLRAAPRPISEVVEAFVQAGQGLAAAHAAGLVHRDFKPENVLVGLDGRVRVGDFGLARSTLAPSAPEEAIEPGAERETHRLATASAPLTRSAALAGTPFYMAPEQFRGESIDARTDQFSFCVALHAAISGVHPFVEGGVETLAEAVTRGQMREPPRR